MSKLTYTIIDTHILTPDMIQSVDKTILTNVLNNIFHHLFQDFAIKNNVKQLQKYFSIDVFTLL